MKKRVHLLYVLAAAVLAVFYSVSGGYLRTFSYKMLQKGVDFEISDRIIFVSDVFFLNDYNHILDKIRKTENSTALLLPQIFNIRIGDYIENVNIKDLEKIKHEYRIFTEKFADTKNLIPVVFVSKAPAKKMDAVTDRLAYFKNSRIDPAPEEFNYLEIKSRRLWMSARNIGFYKDYDEYPRRMPMLLRNGDNVYVNACIEAVRKYYKLTKSSLGIEGNRLLIGDVISVPLARRGEIMLPEVDKHPAIYGLNEFLELPDHMLRDSIIILRSANNSTGSMLSLGAAVSAVMQGRTIRYEPFFDYAGAAVWALFLWVLFSRMRVRAGIAVLAAAQTAVFAAAFWMMRSNYFMDTVILTGVNGFVFFTVYYYMTAKKIMEIKRRRGIIYPYVHPDGIKEFIRNNKDIRNLNSGARRYIFYIDFDAGELPNSALYNKTFEKIRSIIYNKTNDFFIRTPGTYGIEAVIIDEKMDVRALMDMLLEIRKETGDVLYNIFLNKADVYIYSTRGRMFFEDEKYRLKKMSESVEKKRYILIDESGIQEYVKTARYQKVSGQFFNVAGLREES
ncbi:MAG: hypothetical protein ACLFP1_00935 [Candidatus Goldiibacteriota bacterium]